MRNELCGSVPITFGAGDEIRTRDIQLGRLKLYQLSYSRSFYYRLYPRHRSITEDNKIKDSLTGARTPAGSHVVIIDPDVSAEISYIRHIFRLVVGGGFEPP